MEKFAYQSGIAKGGLSEIERGMKEPRVYTILKVCAGLGISVQEFFDFKEINDFTDNM
ncbi:helix-turn-helix transcriptional regulator [bacterium]|nr:helix-turn-helix transcriptional regulator [Alphaproteobacteria bacterium]MBR1425549.1 helix-turn-helix transcriptional regulator [bacterium]